MLKTGTVLNILNQNINLLRMNKSGWLCGNDTKTKDIKKFTAIEINLKDKRFWKTKETRLH